jgi:hypothetical protein
MDIVLRLLDGSLTVKSLDFGVTASQDMVSYPGTSSQASA